MLRWMTETGAMISAPCSLGEITVSCLEANSGIACRPLLYLTIESVRPSMIRARAVYQRIFTLFLVCVSARVISAPVSTPAAAVGDANIKLQFDAQMHSRVIARFAGKEITLGPATASEFITVNGGSVKDFSLTSQRLRDMSDARGAGEELVIVGVS